MDDMLNSVPKRAGKAEIGPTFPIWDLVGQYRFAPGKKSRLCRVENTNGCKIYTVAAA